jgi:peptide/nickel transport system substrate-binding protein
MRHHVGRYAVVGGVVVAVLSLAVIGANAQSSQPASANDVTLRIGMITDLSNANPFGVVAGSDWMVAQIEYDLMIHFSNADLTPVPGLATGCDASSDHMTYTCHIRDGIQWSDGTPLTSKDIAFTFRFVIDNKISQYRSYFPYHPTFETPDDQTLIWHSQAPTFAPDLPPWVYIVPEHVWAKYDGMDKKDIHAAVDLPTVGSGPFVLTQWDRGQGWTMERNPHFWGDQQPVLDKLEFRVFDNQEAMIQALRNGEIDIADGIKPSVFTALEGQQNIATQQVVSDWWLNLAFNFGGQGPDADPLPALQDHTVRQAIEMAIDKEAIVKKVYLGFADPGDTIVREASTSWHYDIPSDQEYPYDPQAANQMLDDAGYVDTNGDGIREDPRTGQELNLRMPASDETTGAVESGQLIVGYLKDIGIGVDLLPSSDGKMGDYWTSGAFDAYIWYWGGDPDPDYQMSVFTSGLCGSWSDGCFSDPTYDRMYDKERTIFDQDQRRAYIDKMQRYLYEQIPGVVLAYPKWLEAYRSDRFTGWTPSPGKDGYLLPVYSYDTLVTVHPVAGASGTPSTPGMPAWVWGAAILAIVLIVLVSMRRGRRLREAEA